MNKSLTVQRTMTPVEERRWEEDMSTPRCAFCGFGARLLCGKCGKPCCPIHRRTDDDGIRCKGCQR